MIIIITVHDMLRRSVTDGYNGARAALLFSKVEFDEHDRGGK
jgi:hypothetical protein